MRENREDMVAFDVVEDILLRLFVTDLLRYKSVCKSWYSLISSPSFIKLHSRNMCNNKDHNRRIAMCKPYTYTHTENVTDCRYYTWSIGGSSNGLVCMYDSSRPENPILVTNPLTRKFRELPIPPTEYFDRFRIGGEFVSRRCLGFGYDSSTDDYKVVIVNYACRYNRSAFVHILSLKSNSWALKDIFRYRFDHDELATPGILFNGALHWFWFDGNTQANKVLLVSFDLAKEKFREIPQPVDKRYVWSDDTHKSNLGILNGSLCIFTRIMRGPDNPPFSIWVMKNDNVKPSWELLPITDPSVMMDHAIHYMLKGDKKFPYNCDKNVQLEETSMECIRSPIFVPTLVSPEEQGTVEAGSAKEKRETEEEENGSKEKRKIAEILPEEEGEGGKKISGRINI